MRRPVENPTISFIKLQSKTIYTNCEKYHSLWQNSSLNGTVECFPTKVITEQPSSSKCYYTLRFVYEFTDSNERILFAAAVPFTFSEHMQLTEKREKSFKEDASSNSGIKNKFSPSTREYTITTATLAYTKTIIGSSMFLISKCTSESHSYFV